MADLKIPYPPTPANVPEDLTDYPGSYRSQQNLLLAGLFVFLLFYLGLICLCALLGAWCFFTLGKFPALKILGMLLCGTFFLYLVKGFFKKHPVQKEMHIEITEDEHPVLFGFIHQLCEELGAPEPNKVFVSPDVNAAVMPRTSLVNLFVEPKKDLLIGLGLVNCVNLSEFKAIMAHEFGHFGQSGFAGSYTYVASRIIGDLVEGEDWFDRLIDWCKRQQGGLSAFGYTVGGILWACRKVLEGLYKAITLQRLAVSREREFHADLVAVSVAGSDAMTHGLLRTEFGHLCLMQALNDLSLAADHKLFTSDLYYHQDKATPVVRKNKKNPELGLPPHLTSPTAGAKVRVFDREEEELDEEEIPEMWRTHPANSDREENAKERFVPAAVDHRSPWVLFSDVTDLKERVTYKFYRMAFKIRKDTELLEPAEVQQFIDDEHAETTYDPKYQGIYDGRPLEPGDLSELNQLIRESPWDQDRVAKVYEKLYEGAPGKHEEYKDLRKEKAALENTPGRPSPRIKRKIANLDKQLDKIWDWFKSLDRRVYLCHVQMAGAVNKEWRDELVERYRFGMEIQRLYMEAEHHSEKAFFFARVLFNMEDPHPEFVAEVMQILRQAWRALKKIVQDAREINMPALKNFEEGERLADFILEGKMVPEPPLTYVKANWAQKLVDQLRDVRRRCGRLHWKSVGGILTLQEKVAAAWQARHAPMQARVVVGADLFGGPVEGDLAPTASVMDALPVVTDQPVMEAEVVEEGAAEPPRMFDDAEIANLTAAELLARVVVENFIKDWTEEDWEGIKPAPEVVEAEAVEAEVVEAEVVEAEVVEDSAPAVPAPAPVAEVPAPRPVPVPGPVATTPPTPPAVSIPEPTPVAVSLPEPVPLPGPSAEPPAAPAPEPEPIAAVLPEPEPVPAPAPPAAPPTVIESAPVVVAAAEVAPVPVEEPEPVLAPAPPKAVLPDDPVGAILALDAVGPVAPSPVQPLVPEGLGRKSDEEAVGDIFALDAGGPVPAPAPPPKPAGSPVAIPAAGGDMFSLDMDDYAASPAAPAAPAPAPAAAVPATAAFVQHAPAKPAASSALVNPAAKPAIVTDPAEAPVGTMTVTRPAKNGRPAVKITFLRPGERSPLAGRPERS